MLISFFLMIIISTSLTVRAQPSLRFHLEACLLFRNREMDYYRLYFDSLGVIHLEIPTCCSREE